MNTLEAQLRAHFERIASAEQPPATISIGTASHHGQSRLRRRRATMIGAPALAAAAALAIGLTSAAVPIGRSHAVPDAGQTAAPQHFSVFSAYAWFGWLPGRLSLQDGGYARGFDVLSTGQWTLTVGAAGQCHLASRKFSCALSAGLEPSRTSPAPSVNGHQAYWLYLDRQPGVSRVVGLTWRYQSGGWAVVTGGPYEGTLRHIARTATFGRRHPSLKFAFKLTGLPPGWQIGETSFSRTHGAPLWAYGFSVTNGKSKLTVSMALGKLGPNACHPDPTSSGWYCRTIHGYHVADGRTQRPGKRSAVQVLLAPDADGFSLQITAYGPKPPLSTVALFGDMTILGANPAHWTTKPVG